MIDEAQQDKGYGKAAMQKVLEYIKMAVFDPDFSGSKDPARLSAARTIHNYFFRKSLDAVLRTFPAGLLWNGIWR